MYVWCCQKPSCKCCKRWRSWSAVQHWPSVCRQHQLLWWNTRQWTLAWILCTRSVLRIFRCTFITTTTVLLLLLFYGHYTGQPALADTSSQELEDFTACMTSLMATSAFRLWRRRQSSHQCCYLHHLHIICCTFVILVKFFRWEFDGDDLFDNLWCWFIIIIIQYLYYCC